MITKHQQHAEEVIHHLESLLKDDTGMAMVGNPDSAQRTPPTIEQEREIRADLAEAYRLFEIRVTVPEFNDRQSLLALCNKYGISAPSDQQTA
ncbi:hypothetical protein G419_25392 [Rhodococcus triatomae BKS 15-14]|nr:hypothetical protein G419_25392 [Rhodococcus triatomae BKS 15-14]